MLDERLCPGITPSTGGDPPRQRGTSPRLARDLLPSARVVGLGAADLVLGSEKRVQPTQRVEIWNFDPLADDPYVGLLTEALHLTFDGVDVEPYPRRKLDRGRRPNRRYPIPRARA